jgi:peptidoglycan/xylan/chitin deacetylase (PgdA/CDA1 family)
MYHYVSAWENPISVHPDIFEAHLQTFTRRGYRGIGLDDALAFLRDGITPPGLKSNERPALITFDDGFLDNYVHAWPLLKKHGHKAIVFAVTGKLETGEARHTMEDVWNGDIPREELPRVDAPIRKDSLGYDRREDLFLNWNEIRRMEEFGVIDVQAHSHYHASVFLSHDFNGFYAPGTRSRTFDRILGDIPWGMPRFKEGPSLANRAFLPSINFLELLSWEMPLGKAACDAYLQTPEKVERLEKVLHSMPLAKWGRMETDDEFRQRIHLELSQCKDAFVQNTGCAPTALCWPWGKYSPEALEIGKELGFELFFATTMGPNRPGTTDHVHRFKAKPKPPTWMAQRLAIYSRAWLAWLYAKVRI